MLKLSKSPQKSNRSSNRIHVGAWTRNWGFWPISTLNYDNITLLLRCQLPFVRSIGTNGVPSGSACSTLSTRHCTTELSIAWPSGRCRCQILDGGFDQHTGQCLSFHIQNTLQSVTMRSLSRHHASGTVCACRHVAYSTVEHSNVNWMLVLFSSKLIIPR